MVLKPSSFSLWHIYLAVTLVSFLNTALALDSETLRTARLHLLINQNMPILPTFIQRSLFNLGYRPPPADEPTKCEGSCPTNDSKKHRAIRAEFGDYMCQVYGWPSGGGMLEKGIDGVEMEFLGLDRFTESSASSDQAEEDAFCNSFRKLGAKWWESYDEYVMAEVSNATDWEWNAPPEVHMTPDKMLDLQIGWPLEGGVWVLEIESKNRSHSGLGKIHMAFNMVERCQAIKRLGGQFFADPRDCQHLVDLFPPLVNSLAEKQDIGTLKKLEDNKGGTKQ